MTPFLQSLKYFRDGPFMTVPVLGCSSFEESYPSLAKQSSTRTEQGDMREEISFCLLSDLCP